MDAATADVLVAYGRYQRAGMDVATVDVLVALTLSSFRYKRHARNLQCPHGSASAGDFTQPPNAETAHEQPTGRYDRRSLRFLKQTPS